MRRRYSPLAHPRTPHTSGTSRPPATPTLLLDSTPSLPRPSDFRSPSHEIVRPPAPRRLPPEFATHREFARASRSEALPPTPPRSATILPPRLSLENWSRPAPESPPPPWVLPLFLILPTAPQSRSLPQRAARSARCQRRPEPALAGLPPRSQLKQTSVRHSCRPERALAQSPSPPPRPREPLLPPVWPRLRQTPETSLSESRQSEPRRQRPDHFRLPSSPLEAHSQPQLRFL